MYFRSNWSSLLSDSRFIPNNYLNGFISQHNTCEYNHLNNNAFPPLSGGRYCNVTLLNRFVHTREVYGSERKIHLKCKKLREERGTVRTITELGKCSECVDIERINLPRVVAVYYVYNKNNKAEAKALGMKQLPSGIIWHETLDSRLSVV